MRIGGLLWRERKWKARRKTLRDLADRAVRIRHLLMPGHLNIGPEVRCVCSSLDNGCIDAQRVDFVVERFSYPFERRLRRAIHAHKWVDQRGAAA